MAARSSKDIPAARFICMTWMIIALYGAILTGLAGAAYYHHAGLVLKNPETIFLVLSEVLFNPWIAGVLIAAVLSAIMSTVSAQLLAAGSALTEDFYRNLVPKGDKQLVRNARLSVLAIAFAAVWIAAAGTTSGTILDLVAYAWGGIGAAFGPVILISLYWRRITCAGAIAGMLAGAVTVIAWELAAAHLHGFFSLYSIVPGFVLNTLTIVMVSYFGKPPSEAVIAQFNQALNKL